MCRKIGIWTKADSLALFDDFRLYLGSAVKLFFLAVIIATVGNYLAAVSPVARGPGLTHSRDRLRFRLTDMSGYDAGAEERGENKLWYHRC
jgi:hypothetical protein